MELNRRIKLARDLSMPSLLVSIVWLGTFLFPQEALGQTGFGGLGGGQQILGGGQQSPGFYVSPSFSIAEMYDDNVFWNSASEGREDDFVSRFTPGVEGGYQSAPLTVLGRYSFASEIFAKNPSLNNALAAQRGGVSVNYLPSQLLTLKFAGGYQQSQRPSDINVDTNEEDKRRRSESYNLTPSLIYQFSPLLTGESSYSFSHSKSTGGETNDSHRASLRLRRELTPRDSIDGSYQYRLFLPSGDMLGNNERREYHVFTLGWNRQVTALTNLSLGGGIRVRDTGAVSPEAHASLTHALQYGSLSASYDHTQGTVTGRSGPTTTDRVSTALSYQLARLLSANVSPFFSRNSHSGQDADDVASETKSYGISLEATYQLSQWMFLSALYQFRFQEGSLLEQGQSAREDRYRNMVMLQLSIGYPYRIY